MVIGDSKKKVGTNKTKKSKKGNLNLTKEPKKIKINEPGHNKYQPKITYLEKSKKLNDVRVVDRGREGVAVQAVPKVAVQPG